MNRRVLIQVVAAVVVVVFAIGIWAAGDPVKPGWLRYFALSVLVATIVVGIWDHWLWRLGVVQRLPGVPRDIRGTWRGTLTSFWEDPVTKVRPDPKTVYMVVRQSSSYVSVVLLTNESSSRSSLAKLYGEETGVSLAYMYLNRPDSRVEHRSRMHNGSSFFEVSGKPATRIRGRYWTDRDSKGELEFGERVSSLAEDFPEASALFAD